MNTFQIEVAKNGENTLLVNDKYIYSKYNPSNDAETIIVSEIKSDSIGFVLIGLGLGYHLEALLELTNNKPILVLFLDSKEIDLFKKYSRRKEILHNKNVELISYEKLDKSFLDYQIIIPHVWLKAFTKHPLFSVLEDIKIQQMSFNTKKTILAENFKENINIRSSLVNSLKGSYREQWACLVSAGPSLNETLELLYISQKKCFILCVGSALKVLLKNNVTPDAVIITDPSLNVVEQIKDSGYNGLLFYLSTANHEMVKIHRGERVILFQKGYTSAEVLAQSCNSSLLETGGSVATTAISLIEYMGFIKLFLIGQDLGFKENNTHATFSTSGISVAPNYDFRKITSNNGELINTTSNLSTYHRWIERKASKTQMEIFNTATNGAKIEHVPYINQIEFTDIIVKREVYKIAGYLENKIRISEGEENGL